MRSLFRRYRDTLSDYRSIVPYAILGIVGGAASALIILAFDQAIRLTAALWHVGANGDGFESLPRWAHFFLPVAGALILGLGFSMLKSEHRETGVVHVLSRMHSHYGALPLRNLLLQFFAGAFALGSGQSGGREGVSVHLGGAINSLLGQYLELPNNSLRVLVACGTAGGIAVAFNTPLAGVIFAMEVIVMEYTVVGFIPVILAAVTATAIGHYQLSGTALLSIPAVSLTSLWEVPFIVLLGICCGTATAGFVKLYRVSLSQSHRPVALRFLLAGLLTGSLGLLLPEVLGMGYDSLHQILLGQVAPALLLSLAVAKLITTSVSCGLGMPIGLIGPNLLIGACIGGFVGTLGAGIFPEQASQPLLYMVIGMAAGMGAVLNAPLAAILAVLELTQTITVAMPAMLAIIAASLTHSEVFRQRSAHQSALRVLQREAPDDPLTQLLHRTHVSSTMEISVGKLTSLLEIDSVESLINMPATWYLVERGQEPLYLIRGAELSEWLIENPQSEEPYDLTDASIRRWSITSVPVKANLRQAVDILRKETAEAACIFGRDTGGSRTLLGVVTLETIEKFTLSNI